MKLTLPDFCEPSLSTPGSPTTPDDIRAPIFRKSASENHVQKVALSRSKSAGAKVWFGRPVLAMLQPGIARGRSLQPPAIARGLSYEAPTSDSATPDRQQRLPAKRSRHAGLPEYISTSDSISDSTDGWLDFFARDLEVWRRVKRRAAALKSSRSPLSAGANNHVYDAPASDSASLDRQQQLPAKRSRHAHLPEHISNISTSDAADDFNIYARDLQMWRRVQRRRAAILKSPRSPLAVSARAKAA